MAPHISTWMCLLSVSIIHFVNSSNLINHIDTASLCSLGIERFSSKISRRHFYQCGDDRGAAATLLECPPETVYNTKKQKCMTRAQESKEEMPIDEKTLGRTVHLGNLFDAKTNTFNSFYSLWSQDTINRYAEKYDKRETNNEFTADKTLKEKISHMDISADLALDIFSGFVHDHGFLNSGSGENEVMVQLKFQTIKYVETISQFTPKDYPEVCNMDTEHGHTHAVTSVSYGIDAIIELRYVLTYSESKKNITDELISILRCISSFSISGKSDVDLTESQRNLFEKTSITLFGHFSMDDIPAPTDFNTFVDFYKILPTLAGEDPDWKGTEVLKVHMTPLKWICTDADIILNGISEALMYVLMDMLDELGQLRIKVEGLIYSDPAQKYPSIKKNLNTYDTSLEQFKSGVTTELWDLIPNIRGGDGHGEEDLNELILGYKNSPFEYELSTEFLAYRHHEIEAIKIVSDNFPLTPNTFVCDNEDFNCGDSILHHDQNIILQLNVLPPPDFTEDFLDGNFHNESELWFNQVTLKGELGGLLQNLAKFAAENVSPEDTPEHKKKMYFIRLRPLNEDIPWTIEARSFGDLISDEFEVPVAPSPPSYYDVTYEGFKFKIDKPSEFVLGCKVYTVDILADGTITEHDDVDFPEDLNPGDLFEVKVSDLEPAKPYTYTVKYKTEVGVGPYSEQSEQVITTPSSAPQEFTVDEVTTTSVRVSWSKPATVAIPENDLEYLVTISGEDGYLSEIMTSFATLEAAFDGLTDATFYSFAVKAIARVEIEIENHIVVEMAQSSAATVTTYSSPLTPTMLPPIPGEIGLHQVTARWEPPRNLGSGVTLQKYVLKMKAQGEDEEITFDDITDTKKEIKSLKEGQLYEFTCQIVTSEGESEFSNPILIQTLSDETVVDKFKNELAETIIRPHIYEAEIEMTRESSVCGYQPFVSTPSGDEDSIVTYEEVYLERNDFTNEQMLDIENGWFKPPATGIYQVDWKVGAVNLTSSNVKHVVKVVMNSKIVKESLVELKVPNTAASIPMSGSLMVEAGQGDKIMLQHNTKNNVGTVEDVSFCVHLVRTWSRRNSPRLYESMP